MSFVSDNFIVGSFDKFRKFCDTLGIHYELVQTFEAGAAEVLLYSDDLVEPPETFIWPGTNKEVEINFHEEIRKLMVAGQTFGYRVEYEVEVDETGHVDYYCDEMMGMPGGDLDGQASTDGRGVLEQTIPGIG